MISSSVWGSSKLNKQTDASDGERKRKHSSFALPNRSVGVVRHAERHFDGHLTLFAENGHVSVQFLFGSRLGDAGRAEIGHAVEKNVIGQIGTFLFGETEIVVDRSRRQSSVRRRRILSILFAFVQRRLKNRRRSMTIPSFPFVYFFENFRHLIFQFVRSFAWKRKAKVRVGLSSR